MFLFQHAIFFSIYIAQICASAVIPSFWQLLVSRGTDKRREKSNGLTEFFFDEYGDLPAMTNVYREIESAVTIIVIRSNNATLVSYSATREPKLQVPFIPNPFVSLNNPWQKMLLTGVAGDCRKVIRETNKVITNHIAEYASPPTAIQLTNEIANFLRSSVATGKRPYACHSFIIDLQSASSGQSLSTIFEVDAAGGVQQVWAGIAGKEMRKGKKFLEDNYSIGITTEQAICLAEDAFDLIKSSESFSPEEPENSEVPSHVPYLEHFILHDKQSK